MEKLIVQSGLNLEEQKQAVQVAFMQGFRTEAAEFPICEIGSQSNVARLYQELAAIKPEGSQSGVNQFAEKDLSFDWRRQQGLESFFAEGYLLQDHNHDFLADHLALKICLEEAVDVWQLSALCQLMFRFGMETTAYEGELFASPGYQGNRLIIEDSSQSSLTIVEKGQSQLIKVKGRGQSLVEFMAAFCQFFPDQHHGQELIDVMQEMTKSFCLQNSDGQQVYLAAHQQGLADQPFLQYIEPVKTFEKEYPLFWEVAKFKEILDAEVYPLLRPGDQVAVQGILSEGPEQRKQLVEEIRRELLSKEVEVSEIVIISAYKQGFSWISEYVIPELNQFQELDRLVIHFKPFLPEGQTDWQDEDGATPTYHNVGDDNADQWYDLPIRFLQELYPIDDALAESLALSHEGIEFVADSEQATTYVLKGYVEDQEVYQKSYQAAWAERPYISQFPELGKTHPSTGQIRVTLNHKEVIKRRIKTDLEQIWDIYQEELLPTFGNLLAAKTDGLSENCPEPLFSKIILEATVSEPDYQLNSRQDMISSLNSFHEDLYFVGLDYFKKYGLMKWNKLLDAPGLLLPKLKVGEGHPSFKCTVYDQEDNQPFIWQEDRKLYSGIRKEDLILFIEEVSYNHEDGLFDLVIRAEGIDERYLAQYAKLVTAGHLESVNRLAKVGRLTFKTMTGNFVASPSATKLTQSLSIEDIELKETEVIGYQAYAEIIEQLKQVPELAVYQIGTTYEGREIYGIELCHHQKGYVSRVKRLTNYPSLIINARHHANEVSGTNGALLLLKELLTNSKYERIAERLNLVIVPLENVDGAEIHYQLQLENPCWKLHVARFNAVGKEFYHEYFNFETIYPEALAFTKIWYQFLPDVVVDNHGVPSHEWDQQFSGYTSPSYKGFWLPRSLLYGYFWAVKDDKFKVNWQLNHAIEKEIALAISENQEMTALNKEWMARFETYAHQWLPKLFPADYYHHMINYWIYFNHEKTHRYPSIRFPWITTVAYTSEVADETAQGAYLKLCAETHVTHDKATIDLLLSLTPSWSEEWQVRGEVLKLERIRQRPLLV